jgi:hypothetical protein
VAGGDGVVERTHVGLVEPIHSPEVQVWWAPAGYAVLPAVHCRLLISPLVYIPPAAAGDHVPNVTGVGPFAQGFEIGGGGVVVVVQTAVVSPVQPAAPHVMCAPAGDGFSPAPVHVRSVTSPVTKVVVANKEPQSPFRTTGSA